MIYFLIGFKACGKSTIGKRLAELMDVEFVDLDQRIEDWYEQHNGSRLTFREIYRQVGPEAFGRIEQQVLEEIEAKGRMILSVGGATVMNEQNRHVIKQAGKVIYIVVEPESLYERIMADGVPAFFDADDPRGSFDRLFEQRTPVYETMADYRIETTGLDIEQSTQKVYDVIG